MKTPDNFNEILRDAINQMDDEEDIMKPCPFCGGKARLEKMGYPHHVYCTECGARITGIGFDEDGEKSAIEKWNRRVQDD